jgi:hypothetical protein
MEPYTAEMMISTKENKMKLTQNHIERLQDLLERGEITADQANVEKVKMARVQVVTCRLPAQVRKALNEAVKSGELCHTKKNGKRPEVYYHPNFEYLAKQSQREHEQATLKALAGIMVSPLEVSINDAIMHGMEYDDR